MQRRKLRADRQQDATTCSEKHYLVRFEDNNIITSKEMHVKKAVNSNKTMALWLPNFRWYDAEILAEGSKEEMDKKRDELKTAHLNASDAASSEDAGSTGSSTSNMRKRETMIDTSQSEEEKSSFKSSSAIEEKILPDKPLAMPVVNPKRPNELPSANVGESKEDAVSTAQNASGNGEPLEVSTVIEDQKGTASVERHQDVEITMLSSSTSNVGTKETMIDTSQSEEKKALLKSSSAIEEKILPDKPLAMPVVNPGRPNELLTANVGESKEDAVSTAQNASGNGEPLEVSTVIEGPKGTASVEPHQDVESTMLSSSTSNVGTKETMIDTSQSEEKKALLKSSSATEEKILPDKALAMPVVNPGRPNELLTANVGESKEDAVSTAQNASGNGEPLEVSTVIEGPKGTPSVEPHQDVESTMLSSFSSNMGKKKILLNTSLSEEEKSLLESISSINSKMLPDKPLAMPVVNSGLPNELITLSVKGSKEAAVSNRRKAPGTGEPLQAPTICDALKALPVGGERKSPTVCETSSVCKETTVGDATIFSNAPSEDIVSTAPTAFILSDTELAVPPLLSENIIQLVNGKSLYPEGSNCSYADLSAAQLLEEVPDVCQLNDTNNTFQESQLFHALNETFPDLVTEVSSYAPKDKAVLLNLQASEVSLTSSIYDFNLDVDDMQPLLRPKRNAGQVKYQCDGSDDEHFSGDDGSVYEPRCESEESSEDSDPVGDQTESPSLKKSVPPESLQSKAMENSNTQKFREVTVQRKHGETLHVSESPVAVKTLRIQTAVKGPTGRRVWDKKYPCKFCNKLDPKLPRHFERHHAQEPEVGAFLALPKNSEARKQLLDKLRSDGEKLHHFQIYARKEGNLNPKKRPTTETGINDYLPCEDCCRLIKKSYLARHVAQCKIPKGESSEDVPKRNMRGLQARCALLLPTDLEIDKDFRTTILEKMRFDEAFKEIFSDRIILHFGQRLFSYLGRQRRNHRTIKDRLRELGRFMDAVKQLSPDIKKMEALMHPSQYKLIIKAIKITAGFDETTGIYETPSLALKLGQSMKKCIVVYKGMCLDDPVLLLNVPNIKLLQERLEENASIDINKDAHSTLSTRSWNAPRRLPLTADVQKLHAHLLKRNDEIREAMKSGVSDKLYREFCEVTLCRVLLLNRRRVGEIQYMELKDYQRSKENSPRDDDPAMKTLSEVETVLVKTLQRIVIRGKKGRGVPVLLTEDMQSAVEALIALRPEVGVPEDNEYLFPALHAEAGHHRADVVLRKMAKECGASDPSLLTGTRLRKHVGTLMTLLNLRDHELDAVADFMGHDIRVHRLFYRLSSDTMQLAKVSKVLLNMEKGQIEKMKGLNLDEITVDDEVDDVEDEDADDPFADFVDEEPAKEVKAPEKKKTKKRVRNDSSGADSESGCDWAPNASKKERSCKKTVKRHKFTPSQSETILKHFERLLLNKITPQKHHVDKFVEAYPEFGSVPWDKVKQFVRNKFLSLENKSQKKKSQKK
ncbi:uncharacterized protein LOC117643486 [Thrips palmi]|uniref:Uncharacterized protein LOC117643486 n=1 Tax=Thrips palmi TaxID=161013 RepID=A0A6P8YMD9_THRPL|nr:uncharacterized protein LOC117643486 [Thrips palmi]